MAVIEKLRHLRKFIFMNIQDGSDVSTHLTKLCYIHNIIFCSIYKNENSLVFGFSDVVVVRWMVL